MDQNTSIKIKNKIQEDLSPTRNITGLHLKIVATIAIIWSLFQLWYASPFPFWFNIGMFKGLPARAIHLGFALLLAFLIFPYSRGKKISVIDVLISFIAAFCCLYIYLFYDQLVDRGGILLKITLGEYIIPIEELIIGICGILILLEATRRVIGIPLVIIAICFLLFSYFGKYAPEMISHGGLSLKRLVGFQWFDQEAIFGIPIGVSGICHGWKNDRRSSQSSNFRFRYDRFNFWIIDSEYRHYWHFYNTNNEKNWFFKRKGRSNRGLIIS